MQAMTLGRVKEGEDGCSKTNKQIKKKNSNPRLISPGLLSAHFKRSDWLDLRPLLAAITPSTMARQGVLFLSHIPG